jgi:hypothetical protein
MPQSPPIVSLANTTTLATDEVHMLVTFDSETQTTVYRPVVPAGQTWVAVIQFAETDSAFMPELLKFWQDSAFWFSAAWGPEIQAENNGITCTIANFGKQSATLTIENRNATKQQIILKVIPTFSDGKEVFPGTDPQVVLPPSK